MPPIMLPVLTTIPVASHTHTNIQVPQPRKVRADSVTPEPLLEESTRTEEAAQSLSVQEGPSDDESWTIKHSPHLNFP